MVLTPWNLPLWWQLRRLRFAIEVDCDARVLDGGPDAKGYALALLEVGERGSAPIAVVAGMAESRTFLEQRLRKMLSKPKRLAWAAAAGLAGLGVVLAASAAEVSPPNAGAQVGHHRVAIDPKLLDAYAGYYLLGDKAVLTVKREGDHLTIQLTAQPEVPVFPETQTRFFAKIVDAQFNFVVDAAGKASGVILHQFGHQFSLPRIDRARAEAVTSNIQARVKAQTPSPGTEAAVRELDAGWAAGKPPYEAMTAELARASRPQIARAQAIYANLGPMQDVRFLGVNGQGSDVYDVRHANGVLRWTVSLDQSGKIASALVQPGP